MTCEVGLEIGVGVSQENKGMGAVGAVQAEELYVQRLQLRKAATVCLGNSSI